jgi:hypothetical protein
MGSSSPQPQTTTQQTKSEPWSVQAPHLESIFGEAKRLYNDPSTPQFYPGQTFANPSQSTLQSIAGTEARALQGSPVLAGAQNEATKTLNGDYLNAGNPYFSTMADNVRANVLPGLDSRYIASGRTGSGLHGRAVGEGLGSAIGSLAYQNYGDERNRMTGAMNSAPNLASADYLDTTMLGQAGAAREAIDQKSIDESMGRFNFAQNLPQAKLADYRQIVDGTFGGTSNTTGTQYVQQQNPWMQALGAVAGAAGTGLGIWAKSDVRAKENIERVGTFDDTGLPIYRYNYKGQQAPMFGPMAQEVLKVKPEAVAMLPDGYLGVDYLQVS